MRIIYSFYLKIYRHFLDGVASVLNSDTLFLINLPCFAFICLIDKGQILGSRVVFAATSSLAAID